MKRGARVRANLDDDEAFVPVFAGAPPPEARVNADSWERPKIFLNEALNVIAGELQVRYGLKVAGIVGNANQDVTGNVAVVGHGANVLEEFRVILAFFRVAGFEGTALELKVNRCFFFARDESLKKVVGHWLAVMGVLPKS
jgi:hypothetical protein